MTRGKLILLVPTGMYISYEFNGDMYMENGHGPEVIKRLKRTNGRDKFEKEVRAFDKANFEYYEKDDPVFSFNSKSVVDCTYDTYMDKWFSDYLYVKNADKKDREVINKAGKTQIIKPGEIFVINFGTIVKTIGEDEDSSSTDVDEEPTDDSGVVFEPVVFNSFTVDGNEIAELYKAGFIKAIPPTDAEVYDAIHSLLAKL